MEIPRWKRLLVETNLTIISEAIIYSNTIPKYRHTPRMPTIKYFQDSYRRWIWYMYEMGRCLEWRDGCTTILNMSLNSSSLCWLQGYGRDK